MTMPAYIQTQGKIEVPNYVNTISLSNIGMKALGPNVSMSSVLCMSSFKLAFTYCKDMTEIHFYRN